jgi:hypothetical protein
LACACFTVFHGSVKRFLIFRVKHIRTPAHQFIGYRCSIGTFVHVSRACQCARVPDATSRVKRIRLRSYVDLYRTSLYPVDPLALATSRRPAAAPGHAGADVGGGSRGRRRHRDRRALPAPPRPSQASRLPSPGSGDGRRCRRRRLPGPARCSHDAPPPPLPVWRSVPWQAFTLRYSLDLHICQGARVPG